MCSLGFGAGTLSLSRWPSDGGMDGLYAQLAQASDSSMAQTAPERAVRFTSGASRLFSVFSGASPIIPAANQPELCTVGYGVWVLCAFGGYRSFYRRDDGHRRGSGRFFHPDLDAYTLYC